MSNAIWLTVGSMEVNEVINLLKHYPNQTKKVLRIDAFKNQIVLHTDDGRAVYIGRDPGEQTIGIREYMECKGGDNEF